MIVGVSRLELHIAHAQSLKEKRQVVKSLIHKIGHRFNVSVAEIEHHELWQRATVAVAHVSNTRRDVEIILNRVAEYAETAGGAELLRAVNSFHDPEHD
jgi:uncharacterized protein